MSRTLNIAFGALCPAISKQVKEQFPDLKHDATKLRLFDRQAENLTFLRIHGIVTEAEHKKATARIIKQIVSYLKQCKTLTQQPTPQRREI